MNIVWRKPKRSKALVGTNIVSSNTSGRKPKSSASDESTNAVAVDEQKGFVGSLEDDEAFPIANFPLDKNSR